MTIPITVPMTMSSTAVKFTANLTTKGTIDLARCAAFLASWPPATHGGLDDDGLLRLAFVTDDLERSIGVALEQAASDTVAATFSTPPADAHLAQVRRILSLDLDGEHLAELARGDQALARLVSRAPGLRPVLFASPYEAAAWAVLSARTPAAAAAGHRRRLLAEYGEAVDVRGRRRHAFPTPRRLLDVDALPGVPAEKIRRLHGVAEASLDGRLAAAHLETLTGVEVIATLKSVRGIGDFYAQLIHVRALQGTDVLPTAEPRVRAAASELVGRPLTSDELATLAARWSPFRGWAAFLLRAA
jgi:DNA-3-methyladenine glycosylase II